MVFTVTSLKSDSHLPKNLGFFCFDESPLKMMKNVFYFILKALFVLRIFNPLLRKVVKWSDTLLKSCSKCCRIFKVCLTILQHCEVKRVKFIFRIFDHLEKTAWLER